MSSLAKNNAKVKFAEILVASGLNPWKVLEAIGYPRCVGFIFSTNIKQNYIFRDRPDDDFAIRYFQRRRVGGEPTFEGADKQRITTGYFVCEYIFSEDSKLPHGERILQQGETRINVYTFDGWGRGWSNVRWQIQFLYSNSTTNFQLGGDNTGGTSRGIPPSPVGDYFQKPPHFFDYYPNGFCHIPAPQGWILPNFLEKLQNN